MAREGKREAASMDKRQAVRKVKQFAELVRQHLPACDIFLYGSYAQGRPRRHSDIDVAVVVAEYAGDLLDMKARLFRLRRDIDVRIVPLLLERKHDPTRFLEQTKGTGRIIESITCTETSVRSTRWHSFTCLRSGHNRHP